MSPPDPDPLTGLDPVRFAAALSVLPIDHPLVVAASLAVETAHTRHERRVALREASHDVSAAADWTRIADRQITHAELQARRARPVYPTERATVKEPAMTDQTRRHPDQAPTPIVEQAPTTVPPAGLVQARSATTGEVLHTFDPADAYTADDITAIADAMRRGDDEEARRLQDRRPHPGAQHDTTQHSVGGAVDRHDKDTLMTPDAAVARLVELGHDATEAQHLIDAHVADATSAEGVPADAWLVDGHDIAQVRAGAYPWVRTDEDEPLSVAHGRAGEAARVWAGEVDKLPRDGSEPYGAGHPKYIAYVERCARTWAARAAGPGPSRPSDAAVAPDDGEQSDHTPPAAHGFVTDDDKDHHEHDEWDDVTDDEGQPWDPAWDAACDAACNAYWDDGTEISPPDRSTPDASTSPGASSPRERDAGPDVVGLVCPECEEDVIEQAPTTPVPYEAHGMQRPAYSHLDGEPLCPVPGPRGAQPADPIEVHAEAAVEQAHRAVTEAPPSPAREVGEQAHREQIARWNAQSPVVVDDGPAAGAW